MSRFKIAIGLSGGVDSSVAAYILKQQGHELVGVFMRFWHDDATTSCPDCIENKCCSQESLQKIKRLCVRLDIPLKIVDFRLPFKKAVVDRFVSYYQHGLTPNPCIWCNEEIKFKLFLQQAQRELNVEKIATGHYADIKCMDDFYYLQKSADTKKDQTYFLYRLDQNILKKTIFPLGQISKKEVWHIADQELADLDFNRSHESQDLCFYPEKSYHAFLARHTHNLSQEGNIVNPQGNIIGRHSGLLNYTIGQHKGINIGDSRKHYVLKIDAKNNTITVGQRSEILCDKIYIHNIITSPILSSHLVSNPKTSPKRTDSYPLSAKIRSQNTLADCGLRKTCQTNRIQVVFKQSQLAPTPGQHCVIYQDNLIVGGGEIDNK